MIDAGDRDPAAGAVAVLADGVGLDMVGVLAGGGRAVVAADAVAADAGVIEHRAAPVAGVVAVVATVVALNMVGGLAGCRRAVVAG